MTPLRSYYECDQCGATAAAGRGELVGPGWREVRPLGNVLRDEDDPRPKVYCSAACTAAAARREVALHG